MKILVFNCGSSSIKFKLFHMPDENVLAEGLVERVGSKDAFASLKTPQGKTETNLSIVDYPSGFSVIKSMLLNPEHGAIKSLSEVNACGHRVVHGGESFGGSMPIDDELETGIEAVFELAPLHNPPNLTGIQQARLIFGDIPQVACFDTAFHHSIPERAYRYALPEKLYTEYKVRRYGFHGMSHQFVARQAAQMLGMHKYSVNLITCHLGNGSSVAAIRDGHSVDTSMGLTPLEGLVMGTRSGDLELYTMNIDGSDVKQITNELGYDGGAFFSPDGSKLIFRSSRPKTPAEIKKYKDLLADGLVEPVDMELYICDADGSNLKQLTNLGNANWSPFFHPSGEKILFSSNHEAERGFPFNLYLIDLDGKNLERVTHGQTFDAFPVFSNDGKYLAFSSNRNNGGGRDTNLFIAQWQD